MASLNNNEKLLKTAFSELRYQQLKQFMINVWTSTAKYKVLMARRAFNLNYAFMSACDAFRNDEYTIENIMSNSGILLQTEEIIDFFISKDYFPRILIVDDLLLHGRGIIKLIGNLENLILSKLRKIQINVSDEEIHRKLSYAINIYVFAQNKDAILIDPIYARKAEYYLKINDLRGLSQEISSSLQICGIANTSYVLSAELPFSDFRKIQLSNKAREDEYSFSYRGNKQLIFLKYKKKLLETIRINEDLTNLYDQLHPVTMTSLAVFGNMSFDSFNKFCDLFADSLELYDSDCKIASILRLREEGLYKVRAQLVSFLLSIWSFAEFYKSNVLKSQNVLYRILLESDFLKIASNFGRASDISYEIIKLFRGICFSDGFYEDMDFRFRMLIFRFADEMGTFDTKNDFVNIHMQDAMKQSEYYYFAENLFYDLGIKAEEAAFNDLKSGSSFVWDSDGKDIIYLNQYLDQMHQELISADDSISCALGLMDSGLMSMNMEISKSKDNEDGEVRCVLKAGELSMFVVPRRFSAFIPALAIVEKSYSYAQNIICSFIDYLQSHPYYDDYDKNEFRDLRNLYHSKKKLMRIYDVKQSFADWDTDLITIGDRISYLRMSDKEGKYITYNESYLDDERKKRHYKFCARQFSKENR